jgi:uncharacterized membrane protein
MVNLVGRRDISYWSVVVNDRFGDHASYSLATGIAPMSARSHYTSTFAAVFLENR